MHEVDAGIGIGYFHMHMHAAEHVPTSHHLQPFHQLVITLFGTGNSLQPIRRGMSTRSKDHQPMLASSIGSHVTELEEFVTSILGADVRASRDFKLSL